MWESRIGELAALGTACCWTVSALAFEAAGKRAGSLPINLIRLWMALALLAVASQASRGMPLPCDATPHMWWWLSLSGIVGFVIGDLCLFRAFVVIGARVSMLVMASVPLLTAVSGWLIMGETMTAQALAGMALTVAGIAIVVLTRRGKAGSPASKKWIGVSLAFGGALGQAVGLVLSKLGMGAYNAVSATQIREIAGIAGFSLLFIFLRAWPKVTAALRNGPAMVQTAAGAFFGPFLGVTLSLYAVQHTAAGIASSLMALVPVLIIPPAVVLFHERISWQELAGALTAVSGASLLLIR